MHLNSEQDSNDDGLLVIENDINLSKMTGKLKCFVVYLIPIEVGDNI